MGDYGIPGYLDVSSAVLKTLPKMMKGQHNAACYSGPFY